MSKQQSPKPYGKIATDAYSEERKLTVGGDSFSKVSFVTRASDNLPCARKVFIAPAEADLNAWRNDRESEATILKDSQSPKVVQYIDSGWADAERTEFHMVMERGLYSLENRATYGNLVAILPMFIRDVVKALHYLHTYHSDTEYAIVHGGVQPDNILISHIPRRKNHMVAKLMNFSAARAMDNRNEMSKVPLSALYTPYIPPEVVVDLQTATETTEVWLTPAYDMYCLGLTILEVVAGSAAMRESISDPLYRYATDSASIQRAVECMKGTFGERSVMVDLVQKLLQPDPDQRIGAKEAYEWLSEVLAKES